MIVTIFNETQKSGFSNPVSIISQRMTSVRKRGKVAEGAVGDDEQVNEKDGNRRYTDEKRVISDDLNQWRHLIPESVLGMYKLNAIKF